MSLITMGLGPEGPSSTGTLVNIIELDSLDVTTEIDEILLELT